VRARLQRPWHEPLECVVRDEIAGRIRDGSLVICGIKNPTVEIEAPLGPWQTDILVTGSGLHVPVEVKRGGASQSAIDQLLCYMAEVHGRYGDANPPGVLIAEYFTLRWPPPSPEISFYYWWRNAGCRTSVLPGFRPETVGA
jgi:hypothetical protein